MCKILVFLSILFSSSVLAQDLKVKVTSGEEPLGYAYIYINGDIKTVADSMGIAYLTMSSLNEGDTISASFVGYEGAYSIFTPQIRAEKEITLDLKNEFTLDEVTVTVDISKLYKKFIKKHTAGTGPIFRRKSLHNMKFKATQQKDSIKRECEGEVSFSYILGKVRYKVKDFDAEGDTTYVMDIIAKEYIQSRINLIHFDHTFRTSARKLARNERRQHGYKGIVDNYRVFTQTFLYKNKNYIRCYQLIYYFDKNSGIISHINIDATAGKKNEEMIYQSRTEYKIVKLKCGHVSVIDIKQNMKFLIHNVSRNIHLYDIKYKKLKAKEDHYEDASARRLYNFENRGGI